MAPQKLLAFDLGASSGRCVAGEYDGSKLSVSLVHRFPHRPVWANGHCYWNTLSMWAEMQSALGMVKGYSSISVDTWGCDFALLAKDGTLLQDVMCYRDPVMDKMAALANGMLSPEKLYSLIGSSNFSSSTVARLLFMLRQQGDILEIADSLLFLPDYFLYRLSGEKSCERTVASTSQLVSPLTEDWCFRLMQKLGFPLSLFTGIDRGGVCLGGLDQRIAKDTGVQNVSIFSTCGHDSAAAMAGVPVTDGEPFTCISSGSWSILEYESPDIFMESEPARRYGFMHEASPEDRKRLVCNIVGLWMVQELSRLSGLGFAEMDEKALQAKPFISLFVPEQIPSMTAVNFSNSLREYFRRTGQSQPQDIGGLLRCVYESMALNFAKKFDELEEISGRPVNRVYLVGGAVHNAFLAQLTADLSGREIVCGPIEAASTGNLMLQLMVSGELAGLDEARQVVAASFPPKCFSPKPLQQREELLARFYSLCKNAESFPLDVT